MPAGWVAGGLLAVAVASLAGVNTDVSAPLRPRRSSSCSASIPAPASRRRRSTRCRPGRRASPSSASSLVGADRRLLLVAATSAAAGPGTTRSSPRFPARSPSSSPPREGLKADMKKVAISQSIRLIILIETIPLVALLVGHPAGAGAAAAPTIAGAARPRHPRRRRRRGLARHELAAAARRLDHRRAVRERGAASLRRRRGAAARPSSSCPCSIALGAIAGSRFRPGDLALLPHIAGPALGAFAIAVVVLGDRRRPRSRCSSASTSSRRCSPSRPARSRR